MKGSQYVVGAKSPVTIASIETKRTCCSAIRRLLLPKELKSHGGRDQNPTNVHRERAVPVLHHHQVTSPPLNLIASNYLPRTSLANSHRQDGLETAAYTTSSKELLLFPN